MTKYQLVELLIDFVMSGGLIGFAVYLKKFRRSVLDLIASNEALLANNKAMLAAIEEHRLMLKEYLRQVHPEWKEPETRPN